MKLRLLLFSLSACLLCACATVRTANIRTPVAHAPVVGLSAEQKWAKDMPQPGDTLSHWVKFQLKDNWNYWAADLTSAVRADGVAAFILVELHVPHQVPSPFVPGKMVRSEMGRVGIACHIGKFKMLDDIELGNEGQLIYAQTSGPIGAGYTLGQWATIPANTAIQALGFLVCNAAGIR